VEPLQIERKFAFVKATEVAEFFVPLSRNLGSHMAGQGSSSSAAAQKSTSMLVCRFVHSVILSH